MKGEDFVEALRTHVLEAAVEDTLAFLKAPPGRRVTQEERALSNWFNDLPELHREYFASTLKMVSQQAVFGVLAAIDGARKIADGEGRFELAYVSDDTVILNAEDSTPLHDLLNAKP